MSIAQYGNDNRSRSFGGFAAGRLPGSATRTTGPNVSCEMVLLKADPDNAADIYIGGADVTSVVGFQLAKGNSTDWIPVNNLNKIWYVCTNAADQLQYLLIK